MDVVAEAAAYFRGEKQAARGRGILTAFCSVFRVSVWFTEGKEATLLPVCGFLMGRVDRQIVERCEKHGKARKKVERNAEEEAGKENRKKREALLRAQNILSRWAAIADSDPSIQVPAKVA